ncbi:translation initiation factor IF-2 [Streptomyces mirabilis]|uniref:translation initiation factor IF-2 n=1 Tax=Streptomyces mirabilis TaxID=68239 RepID=UPI00224D6170|nr:translation initiation factor IF-2 [Streptomyces mirabilis]MCX5351286.1 translation initiation factor IF-2 [Streptomyces mirabilis]
MSGKGTGSTSFEDMGHEQMLAWLDQANAGTVQAAATRLTAAAREIRKIAEELKVRPQWVEWKGEGADAFRAWTGDLANSTLRLGDFSDDSATWLGHASDAIAMAQASIPRDKAGAQANRDAATAAHNDPDAAAVSSKSTTELAALAANKEKVRQEAAAQMTKLGQAYQLSAMQLDGLERPKFPPPPEAIQPAPGHFTNNEAVSTGDGGVRSSSGSGAAGISSSNGSHRSSAEATGGNGAADGGYESRGPARRSLPDASNRVGVHVDGTGVLPQTPSALSTSPVGPPNGGKVDGGGALPTGLIPPMAGGVSSPSANPPRLGRTAIGGRPSAQPGRGLVGPVSRGVLGIGGTTEPEGPTGTARPVVGGRPAAPPGRGITGATPGRATGGSSGIVGGRPTPSAAGSPAGRPASGLPRGNVVGGETHSSAGGRGSTTQRTPASTGRAGVGQSATPADRRAMGTGAGADGGVVGGRPQPQRRSGTRPFTPGGSGLVRNQDSGDGTPASSATGRTGAPPNGTRPSNSRQNNKQGRRAGERSDEQETEQQNGRSTT